MNFISRRSLFALTLSLGMASLIPRLKLSQARDLVHQMKEKLLLTAKPSPRRAVEVDYSHEGIKVGHLCLNETAFHILSLCDGKRSVYEISRVLMRTYGISSKEALKDTSFTLSTLKSLGWIEF